MKNQRNQTKLIQGIATGLALIACVGIFATLFKEAPIVSNPNEKMYSYAVLSDIHQEESNNHGGREDFQNAVAQLNKFDLEFAFITGDVGYYSTSAEMESYKSTAATADFKLYPIRGNHDTGFTDEVWKAGTGVDENFEIIKGNDVFLGMSMYESTVGQGNKYESATLDEPFKENADWLVDKLAKHKGKRIAIFMHMPLPGGAGLIPGATYGFTSSSTEDDEIWEAIQSADNVTIYSGHTHYEFAVEEVYPNMNVCDVDGKNINTVHVPSVAYPRNSSGGELNEKSQCYIVDVYKKKTVLRAFDLRTGAFMEDYTYTLNSDGTVVRGNEISEPSEDNSSSGKEETTVTLTPITGSIVPVNNTVYGGVCGNSTTVNQLKSTLGENYNITFKDLNLTSTETAVYMSNANVSLTINIEGENTITTTQANQRGISSSSTTGNYIKGIGSDAVLNITAPTGTNAVIKGGWTIENVDVIVAGGRDSTTGGTALVNGNGIKIQRQGSFAWSGTKAVVLPAEHGYIVVDYGSFTTSTSQVTITAYPDVGYKCVGVTSNGTDFELNQAFSVPPGGGTLTLKGRFAKA